MTMKSPLRLKVKTQIDIQRYLDSLADTADGLLASVTPPCTILPVYLSAIQIAGFFDTTGLGKSKTAFAGFAICNGNNGTPNINNVFPRWSTAAAGTTGGEDVNAHTHTGPSHTHTGPSHTHALTAAYAELDFFTGYISAKNTGGHTTWSTTQKLTGTKSANVENTTGGVVIGGTTDADGTGATGAGGTGVTGAPSDTENRPAFSSIVPVMRLP